MASEVVNLEAVSAGVRLEYSSAIDYADVSSSARHKCRQLALATEDDVRV